MDIARQIKFDMDNKRQSGSRSDLLGKAKESIADKVGKKFDMSEKQLQRFNKLNELIPQLQDIYEVKEGQERIPVSRWL